MVKYSSLAKYLLVLLTLMGLVACGSRSASVSENQPPVFSSSDDSASFPENSKEVVYTASATDPDGSDISYYVSGGDDANHFSVDAASGDLSFLEAKDSESPDDSNRDGVYIVEIGVGDADGAASSMALTVRLEDINEAPIIAADQILNIDLSNSTDNSIGHIRAYDDDDKLENWTIVESSSDTLDSSGASNTSDATDIFSVSSDGEITVDADNELSYDVSAGSYALWFTVSDGVYTSAPEKVQVNVTDSSLSAEEGTSDNLLSIESDQSFAIEENSANNALVGTVKASGLSSDTGLLVWEITGGNDGEAFTIDSDDGELRVANASELDYETGITSYTLTLTVSDGSNISLPREVLIDLIEVNDEIPAIDDNQVLSVDENASDGALVGKVVASDADLNTVFQGWTSVSGNFDDAFYIDPDYGYVYIADTNKLDYETEISHYWEIAVSDGKHLAESEVIEIRLVDVNDEPPAIAQGLFFDIDENATNGTIVGVLSASDGDVHSGTHYQDWSIVDGDPDKAFIIDSDGVIRVSNTDKIDYESSNLTYDLQITVSDGINTSPRQTVRVNINEVNDEAPSISAGLSFGVEENAAIGTFVGQVTASDSDVSDTGFLEDWSIVSGNIGNVFAIDSDGKITIATASAPDYESLAASRYDLAVTVGDGVQKSSEQIVTIDIVDVNEAPSAKLDYSFKNNSTASYAGVVAIRGAEITLDGSGSDDIDEGDKELLAYQWIQPEGQAAILSATDSNAIVTFTATETKDYTFTLVLSDGELLDNASVIIPVAESALPESFSASTGDVSGTIKIDLTPYTDGSTYNVYRSSDINCVVGECPDAESVESASFLAKSAGFVDSNLTNGTTYYYIVEAALADGAAERTSEAASAIAVGVLNDTGITWAAYSSNDNDYDCNSLETSPPQDCHNGRDRTGTDDDGHAGFSFTRLRAENGEEHYGSDYSQEPWGCVLDNVTGLIWEVKLPQNSPNTSRGADVTYRWGGLTAIGPGHPDFVGDFYGATSKHAWNDLVNELNSIELCGYDDWRVPTIDELISIIDLGYQEIYSSTYRMDKLYFPHSDQVSDGYWSASPSSYYGSTGDNYHAWTVFSRRGTENATLNRDRRSFLGVRLVRSD